MSHKHSLYDTDPHFSIDPDTRLITDLSNKGTTIVQNDHNSERFTFEMPRLIDGHDMSLCNVVQVHYINIGNGERHSDIYEVNDLQVSPDSNDVVICSWLLSQNATALAGTINFVLRFACTSIDESGETIVDYSWSTGIYTKIVITPGIYNSDVIVEQYSDILEEWRKELFALTADEVGTYSRSEIKTLMSKTANAFTKMVSGTIIRADDVSPIEHTISAKVKSKNLFTFGTGSFNNVTYDRNTQIITISGAGNAAVYTLPTPIPKGTTVTISANCISGTITSAGDGGLAVGGYNKADSGNSWQGYINFPKCTEHNVAGLRYTETVTTTADVTHFYVFVYAETATIHSPLQLKIQYELGDTATEYEPYIDPTTVTVTRSGKNLFPDFISNHENTNGTKVTVNDDKSLTVHKAVGADLSFRTEQFFPKGTYTMSNGLGEGNLIYIQAFNVALSGVGETVVEWPGGNTNVYLYSKSTTEGNVTLYPQIEAGNTATKYEAYGIHETYKPDSEGNVDIVSLSPSMTVLTDTSTGVNMELTYNRDCNKVMGDVESALDALHEYAQALTAGGDS